MIAKISLEPVQDPAAKPACGWYGEIAHHCLALAPDRAWPLNPRNLVTKRSYPQANGTCTPMVNGFSRNEDADNMSAALSLNDSLRTCKKRPIKPAKDTSL